MGIALHQCVQILRIQHQQIGAPAGSSGGRSPGVLEHRHFAEKLTRTERHILAVLQHDFDAAGSDEVDGMCGFAFADDHLPGLGKLRAQQLHDVGNAGGVELGEQRHLGNHAPRHDEVAPMNLFGKCVGDDANRQRDQHDAEKNSACGDHLAERRHRHDVAVANGAQRDDRPPHRIRDGAEFVGLHFAFSEMHQRCDHKRRARRHHQTAEQGPPFAVEHVEQRTHGRRIARDFEEPHHPEHENKAKITGQRRGQPERQYRNQVDKAFCAGDILETRAPRFHVAARTVFDRAPDSQSIFNRENDKRNVFDQREGQLIARRNRWNRFENDGGEVYQDQCHQQTVDNDRDDAADRALFQDKIDAVAKV